MNTDYVSSSFDYGASTPSAHLLAFIKRKRSAVAGAFIILNIISVSALFLSSGTPNLSAIDYSWAIPSIFFAYAASTAALGVLLIIMFISARTGSSSAIPSAACAAAVSLRLISALCAAAVFTYNVFNCIFLGGDIDALLYALFNLMPGDGFWNSIFYTVISRSLLIVVFIALILNIIYHIASLRLALSIHGVIREKRPNICAAGTVGAFNTLASFILVISIIIYIIFALLTGDGIELYSLILPSLSLALCLTVFILKAKTAFKLSRYMIYAPPMKQTGQTPTGYYGDGFSEYDRENIDPTAHM